VDAAAGVAVDTVAGVVGLTISRFPEGSVGAASADALGLFEFPRPVALVVVAVDALELPEFSVVSTISTVPEGSVGAGAPPAVMDTSLLLFLCFSNSSSFIEYNVNGNESSTIYVFSFFNMLTPCELKESAFDFS